MNESSSHPRRSLGRNTTATIGVTRRSLVTHPQNQTKFLLYLVTSLSLSAFPLQRCRSVTFGVERFPPNCSLQNFMNNIMPYHLPMQLSFNVRRKLYYCSILSFDTPERLNTFRFFHFIACIYAAHPPSPPLQV